MDRKGNIILFILIGFIVIALIPPIIMKVFPMADIIMRIILAVIIFMNIRGLLGNSIISIIIAGILIYFLVIKWAYVTASLYIFFYFFMTFSFLSAIVWGIGTRLK